MEYFVAVAKQTLFLTLILTTPPVMTALVVGLVISILQATTQVQEQTLTFVPKLVGIIAILVLLGPWMVAQLLAFTQSLYTSFATYVH